MYIAIGAVSTLLGFVPLVLSYLAKIAVEPAVYRSATDPLRASWIIENHGLFPLRHIRYEIEVVRLTRGSVLEKQSLIAYSREIPRLASGEKTTIQTASGIQVKAPVDTAVIAVRVSYHIPAVWWRSSPVVFPFQAERSADGVFAWTHLSTSEMENFKQQFRGR